MGKEESAQFVTSSDLSGCQLFVALKMNQLDFQPLPLNLVPHIVGSLPMIGCWDETKAVSLPCIDTLVLGCYLHEVDISRSGATLEIIDLV